MPNSRQSTKNNVYRILMIVSIAVLLVVGVLLGKDWLGGRRARQTQREMQELYYGKPQGLSLFASALAEEEEEAAEPEAELPPVQKDFQKLLKANRNTVGWLKVGASVDNAVVQSDNEYYLDHNFFGQLDSNGTLFMNAANSLYPRDDVLLIHGHAMKSGAMFWTIKEFDSEAYLQKYPIVSFRTIYDEQEVLYTPIAAFRASMTEQHPQYFDVLQMNFEDDEPPVLESDPNAPRKSKAFQTYLDSLAERSLWQPKVDVTPDDALLMLVTCTYEVDDGRYMLVCRRLREGETAESITALYQTEETMQTP